MQFIYPVHAIAVSNDGIVYASDRSARRIQVFTLAGVFTRQIFVNRAGPSGGSVSGFAFSPDPAQEFLYATDYGNSHIVVMDRRSLEILYQWGTRGAAPGQFQGVHMIATDSQHNLYAAEVAPGARLQKFTFKGFSPKVPPNALTTEQLSPTPKPSN
jgi:DNA-binding beta-propeller fold protein YncE